MLGINIFKVGVRLEVFGRVQGVNFRKMVFEQCLKNDIKGFVRNLDNGNVEINAFGKRGKVKSLVEWIGNSPGLSSVENILIDKLDYSSKYVSFEIVKENSFFVDQFKALKNLGGKLIGR